MGKPARNAGPTSRSLNRHIAIGSLLVVLMAVGVGGWSATASISGAVIASGNVVVSSYSKRVQHKEGGIVGEIRVRDGQMVKAGAVLLKLDDTVTKANLAILNKRINDLQAQLARLIAERDHAAEISFPTTLLDDQSAETVAAVRGQRSLFDARRETLVSQKAQLQQRIIQLGEEISGMASQSKAKQQEIDLINSELNGLMALESKGLVPVTRVLSLQREKTRLDGEYGQLISGIARTKGRISETELQIGQLNQDLLAEVARDLRDTESKIAELVEQKIGAQDQLKRVELRSPHDGMVHQLAVHTIGGVIAPGDTVLMIVPQEEELLVEARVQPTDIDQLFIGQQAVVRFAAFNQRTTPELNAVIETISADLTQDSATGATYYRIRVRLSEEERERLGDLALVPGMPTETFISTGNRTALSYFIKPLSDQITKAFREE